MKKNNPKLHFGRVLTVVGPVIDVAFDDGYMPRMYEKLLIDREDGTFTALEVLQHVRPSVARCIALQATEG